MSWVHITARSEILFQDFSPTSASSELNSKISTMIIVIVISESGFKRDITRSDVNTDVNANADVNGNVKVTVIVM